MIGDIIFYLIFGIVVLLFLGVLIDYILFRYWFRSRGYYLDSATLEQTVQDTAIWKEVLSLKKRIEELEKGK